MRSRIPVLAPRRLAATVLAAGTALTLTATAPAVAADTVDRVPTPCEITEVTVVVEGHGVGCAEAGLTGAQALEAAGFPIIRVETQPGFICRIAGTPADEDCVVTPSASSYWAYYQAELGGEWAYSQFGADSHQTEAGMVEGWAYGAGAVPGPVPGLPVDDPAPQPDPQPTPDPDPRPEPEPEPLPLPGDDQGTIPAPTGSLGLVWQWGSSA